MSRQNKLVAGIIIAVCLVALIAAIFVGPRRTATKTTASANGIAVIRIEGVITGGTGGSSLWGGITAGADRINSFLEQARKDESIKAVVLRINSPGGSSVASQEIGEEVKKLRQSGKPVIVSMGDAAASGGYWIAAHADTIMVNPSTITGSIGVIMETQNL